MLARLDTRRVAALSSFQHLPSASVVEVAVALPSNVPAQGQGELSAQKKASSLESEIALPAI